ncbi:hypothetical protein PG996_014540 [Apiospora saccharicola]|uniref:Sin3-associated polypeptide Sap18 n=1 Tax=Apiospora saccharicola TaxID=335842 RepID=A0ABR1TKM4_9PEZI
MDHRDKPPFALQLVYRTGAFHRPDEFSAHHLPPHLTVHTWNDCTLLELAHHLASAPSLLLPEPAIGTRLAFRLIFPDTRSGNGGGPSIYQSSGGGGGRFMVKDLGSLVIGDGGPGLDPDDPECAKQIDSSSDADKTLADARFVVGDYISVAILPPLGDGSVAPASSARMGRGAGAGEAGRVRDRFSGIGGGPGGIRDRENGFGGGGRPGRSRGRGGGPGGPDDFGRGGVPMGEWRRGERLPDAPSAGRGRGRGRF